MAKDRTILLFGSSSPKGTGADLLIAKAPTNATAGSPLTGLNYYELCINNLAADPTIFIRDSADVIRSFKDQTYIDNLYNSLKGGALPTTVGYRNLSELSNTLLTFLTGANNADSVINRWTELANFLSGIPDNTTTLAGLMANKVNITDYATAAAFGVVRIGSNINVSGGIISVATSNGTNLGLVKNGNRISIAADGAVSVLEDSTHRFITDAERTAWNAKLDKATFDNIFEITTDATSGVKTLHIKGNAYADGGMSTLGDNTVGGGSGTGIDYEALQTLLTDSVNAYSINTAFLGNIDINYIKGKLGATYENNLGNPASNGMILSSTTAGVRSWVAPYSHPTSGVTAGTYRSVTVDENGHVTAASNPNTLSGYGISATDITAQLLTGYAVGANTAIAAADSILVAMQKLQGQMNNRLGLAGGSITGSITPNVTNTLNLGSASLLFANIYATTFTGALSGNASTATKLAAGRTIGITGDATWTSPSFDGSGNVTAALTLANTGVTAGTYRSVTVDAKGRVTAGTNPNTLSGYGISASDITAQLLTGYAIGTSAGVVATDSILMAIGKLQFDVNQRAASSHVGSTGAAHGLATSAVAGFMSAADKSKLDGVEANANNYVHPTTDGNKHIPSGGATGQILVYSAAGTAEWTGVISCGTY
ncbi:hypothetical protein [uncultured Bacteroides sp.]|uniref:hypothetical protein n=1 Tax=uncultured Bacteroides sp. TaxID=162156 RepID=UPI002AAB7A07|nr:hypothetical protein [uncultured Bacteroides sp.]